MTDLLSAQVAVSTPGRWTIGVVVLHRRERVTTNLQSRAEIPLRHPDVHHLQYILVGSLQRPTTTDLHALLLEKTQPRDDRWHNLDHLPLRHAGLLALTESRLLLRTLLTTRWTLTPDDRLLVDLHARTRAYLYEAILLDQQAPG